MTSSAPKQSVFSKRNIYLFLSAVGAVALFYIVLRMFAPRTVQPITELIVEEPSMPTLLDMVNNVPPALANNRAANNAQIANAIMNNVARANNRANNAL